MVDSLNSYLSHVAEYNYKDMIKACTFLVVWLINCLMIIETIRLSLLSIVDRSNWPIALAVAVTLYWLLSTSVKRVNSLTEHAKEALGMDY